MSACGVPFISCGRPLKQMVTQGAGGNIVVISSPHAHMAIPGAMAYNMAKAANDQMARTAACELAQHRIRVNIIHPGWTDTPGERKFFSRRDVCGPKGRSCLGDGSASPKRSGAASSFCVDPEQRVHHRQHADDRRRHPIAMAGNVPDQ